LVGYSINYTITAHKSTPTYALEYQSLRHIDV